MTKRKPKSTGSCRFFACSVTVTKGGKTVVHKDVSGDLVLVDGVWVDRKTGQAAKRLGDVIKDVFGDVK